MIGAVLKGFEVFSKTKHQERNKILSWGQARARCSVNIFNIVDRFQERSNKEWHFYQILLSKSVDDLHYQWSEAEYRQIFWLCEYINSVQSEYSENHLWQIRIEECKKAINKPRPNPRNSQVARQAVTWGRAFDFISNINVVSETALAKESWDLCQRYVAYINKDQSDVWSPVIKQAEYHLS